MKPQVNSAPGAADVAANGVEGAMEQLKLGQTRFTEAKTPADVKSAEEKV